VARRTLAPPSAGEPAGESDRVLEFELPALDGSRISTRQYDGRVVVVDFWATWCAPCRIQADILHALHDAYGSRPVSFLAVNVGETEALVRDFVREDPFDYPVVLDPEQHLSTRYGIYALPTLMVLDANQRIVFSSVGVVGEAQVDAAIRRALAAAS
jgi:thiol-disulfide isomerase/thioredoxin